MTAPPLKPIPYRVSYSGRVRIGLRVFLDRARAAGRLAAALAAVKLLDQRLKIYPQFGEPVRDLIMPGETTYVATLPPLYIEYIVDEPNRCVFDITPVKTLPHSGFA